MKMITQETIIEKHSELSEHYALQQIDDFDVFVRTRVVEYFLNASHEAVDDILSWVDSALSNKEVLDDSNVPAKENIDDAPNSNSPIRNNHERRYLKSRKRSNQEEN
jgi:hypothetical protein